MNNVPKVSVIIPVYNAEKYLHRCIDSVLSQSFSNFELLLIDDGSNDKSGDICDEYAAKDSRIRVYHKENGGVSSARNVGLNNANGYWITFVDADDWIEPNTLSNVTFDDKYDVIRIPCNFNSSGKYYQHNIILETNKEVIKYLRHNFCNACWGRLYKKNIIGNIRFNESIRMGEDVLFFTEICPSISRMLIIHGTCGYTYFNNLASATNTLGYTADLDMLSKELIRLSKINEIACYVLMSVCYSISIKYNLVNDFLKCISIQDVIMMKTSPIFKIKVFLKLLCKYIRYYYG